MATSIKLSKISKINLRDCWQNEATDFTPWLASEENQLENTYHNHLGPILTYAARLDAVTI